MLERAFNILLINDINAAVRKDCAGFWGFYLSGGGSRRDC